MGDRNELCRCGLRMLIFRLCSGVAWLWGGTLALMVIVTLVHCVVMR